MPATQEIKLQAFFPSTVLFEDLDRDFSSDEKDSFLDYQDNKRDNVYNLTSVCSKILDDERLKNLKLWLESQAQKYIDHVLQPVHPLTLRITTSWINYTEKDQSHHTHTHPNSFLSGVFYIDCDKDDKIMFHRTPRESIRIEKKNYNLYNSESWWLPAISKRLYVFPSNLEHCVPTVDNDHVRISLSFNTWISGKITGGDGGISDLDL